MQHYKNSRLCACAGCRGFVTDSCVPLSRLTEAVLASQAACQRHGILAPMVGHVGDANFHMMQIIDPGKSPID